MAELSREAGGAGFLKGLASSISNPAVLRALIAQPNSALKGQLAQEQILLQRVRRAQALQKLASQPSPELAQRTIFKTELERALDRIASGKPSAPPASLSQTPELRQLFDETADLAARSGEQRRRRLVEEAQGIKNLQGEQVLGRSLKMLDVQAGIKEEAAKSKLVRDFDLARKKKLIPDPRQSAKLKATSRKDRLNLARDMSKDFVLPGGEKLTFPKALDLVSSFMDTGVLSAQAENLVPVKKVTKGVPTQKDILDKADVFSKLFMFQKPNGNARDLTPKEALKASKEAFNDKAPPDNFIMRSTVKDVRVRSTSLIKLIADYKKQISDLRSVASRFSPDMVGLYAASESYIRRKLRVNPNAKVERFKTAVNLFYTLFLKSLSGSQVTFFEEQRIKEVVPIESDDPVVFKAKLDELQEILERHLGINETELKKAGFIETETPRQGQQLRRGRELKLPGVPVNQVPQLSATEEARQRGIMQMLNQVIPGGPTEEQFNKAVSAAGVR